MTPELFNRIDDELRTFLNRPPTIGEVINAQGDHIIMMRVNARKNEEEKGILQDQIDTLETRLSETEAKSSTLTTQLESKGIISKVI